MKNADDHDVEKVCFAAKDDGILINDCLVVHTLHIDREMHLETQLIGSKTSREVSIGSTI